VSGERVELGRSRRPPRIGITGPIGCGKSTVAGWLGEMGAFVIDADRVAREVTPAGSPELAAIVESFGPGVLLPDGALDRAALGRVVFGDPGALARLEAIVHPAVRRWILAMLADADRAGPPAVVIEAIKLVEGGLAMLCDEVWLVTCDPAEQRDRILRRERAAGRASDPADAEARIATQGDLVTRLAPHATRVIDTSHSIAESRLRVEAAWGAATSSLGG
jgi:dephospho-CoA kinase